MTAETFFATEVTEDPYFASKPKSGNKLTDEFRIIDKFGTILTIYPSQASNADEIYLVSALFIKYLNYDHRFDVLKYLTKHNLLKVLEKPNG